MIFTEAGPGHDQYSGDYLRFKDEGRVSPKAKTSRWSVWSRHDSTVLGEVRWYIRWRQYVTIMLPGKILDKKCHRELADFCEYVTAVHNENL